jgi:hypothetical protein
MQRRAGLGLDAHDSDVTAEPRRHPGDQPAAADGHEHRVGVRDLVGELQADRPGAGHDLGLIVRVHGERAALGLACGRHHRRLVVVPRDDLHVRTQAPDAFDLGVRRRVGTKISA